MSTKNIDPKMQEFFDLYGQMFFSYMNKAPAPDLIATVIQIFADSLAVLADASETKKPAELLELSYRQAKKLYWEKLEEIKNY